VPRLSVPTTASALTECESITPALGSASVISEGYRRTRSGRSRIQVQQRLVGRYFHIPINQDGGFCSRCGSHVPCRACPNYQGHINAGRERTWTESR
jgi:hypothetical protein